MYISHPEVATAKIDLKRIKNKKINIVVFGHGKVGSHLIDQIIASQETISKRRGLDIAVVAVANSKTVLFKQKGLDPEWRHELAAKGSTYSLPQIVDFTKKNQLENLIAIDNTASIDFTDHYEVLIANGFHLVSSNKVGNTRSLTFYQQLRKVLQQHNKEYLYETNVGAGLPLIDTIKLLHVSGENITRIKGVFSGSLSYIFNQFSEANAKIGAAEATFSRVLGDAIAKGFTEPDPREDLCGNDVGRKLLILARELDLHYELEEVSIQNLIPKPLRNVSKASFLAQLRDLDVPFHIKRRNLPKDQVLRYVGDLHGDLSESRGAILDVKLVSVPKNSMLGQLQGSDSLFEIYTESYGENPIVIQGAGAGAAVTARGVFGDILRLSSAIN